MRDYTAWNDSWNIQGGGRPRNIEDVRSLLMACQYNAKFTFDNTLNLSYEEVTATTEETSQERPKINMVGTTRRGIPTADDDSK